MLRRQAIESLLLEEVAGIAGPRRRGLPKRSQDEEATAAVDREDLAQAAKKALGLAVVCGGALLILLVSHRGPAPFMSFEGVEAVFSLAALLVASYGGFRLGQWEKYRSVARALDDLAERIDAG